MSSAICRARRVRHLPFCREKALTSVSTATHCRSAKKIFFFLKAQDFEWAFKERVPELDFPPERAIYVSSPITCPEVEVGMRDATGAPLRLCFVKPDIARGSNVTVRKGGTKKGNKKR